MSGTDAFRLERDSLGEVRVPLQALYGAQTARAVENFPISGLRPYRARSEERRGGKEGRSRGWAYT